MDDTGVGLDLCEKEQSALARRYVLTQTLDTSEPWSHAGPRSISPFAPCASSRVPHIIASIASSACDGSAVAAIERWADAHLASFVAAILRKGASAPGQ